MRPIFRRLAAIAALVLVSCFFGAVALAVTDAPPPGPSANVDPTDIGVIAVMAALVGLLTQATKIGALSNLVPPWLRPWIALGLGVIGGVLDQVIRGDGWLKSILGGIVAAITAVTGNQLGSGATASGRASKEASAAVKKALEGPEAEVGARLNAIASERAAIAAMPDKTARLNALADAATRASNGVR